MYSESKATHLLLQVQACADSESSKGRSIMGNKPDRCRKMQQPYNQMVEDAIAALKDRPGSSQADIFNYLEAKYEGKISPKNKHNLQTVIRSVIGTKKRLRQPGPSRKPGGGGNRFKAKKGSGRKFGRRGGGRVRGLSIGGGGGRSKGPVLSKSLLKTSGTPGKTPGLKTPVRSNLLRRVKRGKLFLKPPRRTASEGSMFSNRTRRNKP